ncbi:MAG: glycosyltransferase [Bacteroidetes bacterium]|nr:glycosyltransferase [Bacteroidota bacterium]
MENLKLCCASVADQNIEVEHLVMDGGSKDGTVEWLATQKLTWFSEKDSGMYNALNKAIAKSKGEIIGHLNCDEQYLPGVLSYVIDFFKNHPEVDFLAADFIVTNPSGEFMAYRKSFQPRWVYFFSNYLYTTTCSLFYRRKIFVDCNFDESYKSIADVIFLYSVIKKGYKGQHVRKYFAAFTYSGNNLSLNPISAIEKKRFNKTLPKWYLILKPVFKLLFFVERLLHGTYFEKSVLSYSIFTQVSLGNRLVISKKKPSFKLNFIARTLAI